MFISSYRPLSILKIFTIPVTILLPVNSIISVISNYISINLFSLHCESHFFLLLLMFILMVIILDDEHGEFYVTECWVLLLFL